MDPESSAHEDILHELQALRERVRLLEASASARHRAEEALRQQGERLQALIANSLDDVAVLNSDGTVRFHSPSMGQVLGYYPDEQSVGSNALDFLHPDERPMADEILKQVRARPGVPFSFEMRARHADGTWHTMEVVLKNLIDDPNVRGILANFRDITERKQAEEARIRHAAALARAEELHRSRQRIVTMQESVRREIAQQLHGSVQNRLILIMHRLTELERSAPTPETAEALKDLRQKVTEIVDGYVRPISHRLYPSILRRGLVVALQSLADQFEEALTIELQLDPNLQMLERSTPRMIPEPVRLAAYRIAEEALTNAVKHARGKSAMIELARFSAGWLRLVIRDSGPGFDPQRVETGLGTLAMQDYAEVVGGSCFIRSSEGSGTEVIVTLPLSEPGALPPPKTPPSE